MTATEPEVSIAIPAFQAERYLAETLRSVCAQTAPDLEIVVLDNHSSDRTPEIVAGQTDHRIRVVRNEATRPMAECWNQLIGLCRGRWIKLVCADDLIYPGCVAEQSAVLRAMPDVSLVACRTDLIDGSGVTLRASTGLRRLVGKFDGHRVVREVVRSGGNPIGPSAAVMFRRQDFAATGGFDGRMQYPMDVDLWAKLVWRGRFVGQAGVGSAFRVSAGSATARTSAWSQTSQQLQLMRRLTATDPSVGRWDRTVGYVSVVTMQARRSALLATARRTSVGRRPARFCE